MSFNGCREIAQNPLKFADVRIGKDLRRELNRKRILESKSPEE